MKPTNPKDAIGSGKLPLHLVPAVATAGESLALMWGAMNYGRANWRDAGVRYTIYTDAIERHLGKLKEGQDWDSESGLHHLWHIRACTAILLDADAAGMLTDDRVKSEAAIRALDALGPQVTRIRAAMEAKRGIDDPGAHAATAVAPATGEFKACRACSGPERCSVYFRDASAAVVKPDGFGSVWTCPKGVWYGLSPAGVDDPDAHAKPAPTAVPVMAAPQQRAAPRPDRVWWFDPCGSCQSPETCRLNYAAKKGSDRKWTCPRWVDFESPPEGSRVRLVVPT